MTWTKIGGIKKADFYADFKSVDNVCALKKTSDGFKISMKYFVFRHLLYFSKVKF
jgi:hypothetical protein